MSDQNIRLSHISESQDNIFHLINPDEYRCRIFAYSISHSVMSFRLNKRNSDNLFLTLEPVLYFEGPMWWQGANFHTSTLHEYLTLLDKIQEGQLLEHDGSVPSDLQQSDIPGRLLLVDTPKYQVKILTYFASLSNERPQTLKI